MAKLTIRDEKALERVHELVDEVTTIGRASSNTIKVTDPKFSRHHFRIEKDGEYYKLVDLGSTNGTRVNGVKATTQRLRRADVLKVGETTFLYDGPGEPPPPPPPPPPPLGTHTVAGPEAEANAPKYVLAVLEGAEAGRTFELGREAVTIGRHPSSTVRLEDESASNYHAEIVKEPIGYVVSDLGSTNGTRVKARGAGEFEKIVKTPLAPGMQIRIGKTVLEFRNVGAPAEDDQIFGTVVLEPESLGDKLAERPARSRAGAGVLVGAVAVLVFVGAVALVLKLIPSEADRDDGKPPPPPPLDLGNLVVNGDFAKPVDDRGNPPGWRQMKGQPTVRVVVDPEQEGNGTPPPGQKKGALVIHKSGATAPSCRTVVEGEDKLGVDPGRVYELSGCLKNDGDGLCGLRVTWWKGERRFTQHPVVLIGSQLEWKTRAKDLRPPPWADRATVAVFTEGREGKSCFDNVSFRIKPEGNVPPAPAVSFGRAALTFDGNTGAFSAAMEGLPVVEWDELELVGGGGESCATLLSAVDPQMTQEGAKAVFRGQLYDFALQRTTNYRIAAGPGAWGVEVNVAVDRQADAASSPRLSFYVVGPAATGSLEVSRGGQIESLGATDRQQLTGVQEVLFNAGAAPQLYLRFAPATDMETRCEGRRRLVRLSFASEVTMELAPENVAARQQLAKQIQELDDCLTRQQWARAHALAEQIEQKHGARYREAKEAGIRARARAEEAFNSAKAPIQAQLEAMAKLGTFDAAEEAVKKAAPAWVGTPHETFFSEALERIKAERGAGQSKMFEELAQSDLKRAQDAFNNGVHNVCISLCNKILQRYASTQAAAKAAELKTKAETAAQELDLLNSITGRLLDKARPYTIAGDWQAAVGIVETDPEYRKYASRLTEVNEKVAVWKKKLRE